MMKHRGPDDHGLQFQAGGYGEAALGHARLSIIDLTPGGHQPMVSADGRYSLVFNGEIYNYRELRDELLALGCSFVSQSDSEVLLAAWTKWGEGCLEKLCGMFAFGVIDRQSETLTLVRDAFGIKPLFYARPDWGLCFASELPAVTTLRGQSAELDLQTSYNYLVHGDYDTSASTFVDGIMQLPPGAIYVVDMRSGEAGSPRLWWQPGVAEGESLGFKAATEMLRQLFLDSVRLHLRSDVALGSALSGGIDSSAVVCAIRHLEPHADIHTFSFIAKDSPVSEESWVDLVNTHVHAVPHKVVVEPDELAHDLDDMIRAQGEPFGGTSIYAQYRVFQLAREAGVTVTLDGQGADELLAGYNGYPGRRMHSMLDRGDLGGAASFLWNWAKWPDRKLSHGLKLLVAEYAQGEAYQQLRQWAGGTTRPAWLDCAMLEEQGVRTRFPRVASDAVSGRRLMAELALSITERGLPSLLRHADRNSMRFSVESRVPFLTTKMASFLLSLPEEYLISAGGETKSILRAAMRGIVPDPILDRRDKIGFATPEQAWFRKLGHQARKWLEDDPGLPFLNMHLVRQSFDRMLEGKEALSAQAWRWINFCRWHATVFQPLVRL